MAEFIRPLPIAPTHTPGDVIEWRFTLYLVAEDDRNATASVSWARRDRVGSTAAGADDYVWTTDSYSADAPQPRPHASHPDDRPPAGYTSTSWLGNGPTPGVCALDVGDDAFVGPSGRRWIPVPWWEKPTGSPTSDRNVYAWTQLRLPDTGEPYASRTFTRNDGELVKAGHEVYASMVPGRGVMKVGYFTTPAEQLPAFFGSSGGITTVESHTSFLGAVAQGFRFFPLENWWRPFSNPQHHWSYRAPRDMELHVAIGTKDPEGAKWWVVVDGYVDKQSPDYSWTAPVETVTVTPGGRALRTYRLRAGQRISFEPQFKVGQGPIADQMAPYPQSIGWGASGDWGELPDQTRYFVGTESYGSHEPLGAGLFWSETPFQTRQLSNAVDHEHAVFLGVEPVSAWPDHGWDGWDPNFAPIEPFPWDALPPLGPWPDLQLPGPWTPDPWVPPEEPPGVDIGDVVIHATRAVARATARLQLPISDLWDLPNYPDPYLGRPGAGTTIPDGMGIREERWVLFEVPQYLVANGTAIAYPEVRLATAYSRAGITGRERTSSRPLPQDTTVPIARRYLPRDYVNGSWGDITTPSAIRPQVEPITLRGRGESYDRLAVRITGREWLRLPGGRATAFTVVLVARVHPAHRAPYSLLLDAPADRDAEAMPWQLAAAQAAFYVGLPLKALILDSAPAPADGLQLVALSWEPQAARFRYLSVTRSGRVTREMRTPRATYVLTGMMLGRGAEATAAVMDLFELATEERALSFSELDDVAALYDLTYGISG